MINTLLILFQQRRGIIIEERRIERGEGQERSNDSTEERTENPPYNERRRSSAIAESRIAQVVKDTLGDVLREERSEMEAHLKYAPCLHYLASDHTVTSTFRTLDDLKITVDELLSMLQRLNTLQEHYVDH